jgi:hypothetical protein
LACSFTSKKASRQLLPSRGEKEEKQTQDTCAPETVEPNPRAKKKIGFRSSSSKASLAALLGCDWRWKKQKDSNHSHLGFFTKAERERTIAPRRQRFHPACVPCRVSSSPQAWTLWGRRMSPPILYGRTTSQTRTLAAALLEVTRWVRASQSNCYLDGISKAAAIRTHRMMKCLLRKNHSKRPLKPVMRK